MLARRVVPVVLALAVALAPVALEACQVACAVHSIAAARTGAAHHHAASNPDSGKPPAHSCHEAASAPVADAASSSSAGAAALTGGPHDCSHSDELPANAGALAQTLLHAPAILRNRIEFRPLPVAASVDASAPFARDSIPIPLNLPLRV